MCVSGLDPLLKVYLSRNRKQSRLMLILHMLFFFSLLNLVVICCTYKPTGVQVLVRAYGKKSEVIIDRKQEIMVSLFQCIRQSLHKERVEPTRRQTTVYYEKKGTSRAMTARKTGQDCRTVARTRSTKVQERWQDSRGLGDTRERENGPFGKGRAEQDTT